MLIFRELIRKLFTPVSILFIPHTSRKTLSFKVPSVGILTTICLCIMGMIYIVSITDKAINYYPTKEKLEYYKGQFIELESAMTTLQLANSEFRKLFALDSVEQVLENMSTSDTGGIDMTRLRKQIDKTIDTTKEIKDYIGSRNDLFSATPMGWPVKDGSISSEFGERSAPMKEGGEFHTGVDISAKPGEAVTAAADGIVSFSSRSGGGGNIIAIEHGFGYTTYYAHNKKNIVKVGQIVKRGDAVAYVGSTGSSTGPHLHYEIWKNGINVDPAQYLKGGNW